MAVGYGYRYPFVNWTGGTRARPRLKKQQPQSHSHTTQLNRINSAINNGVEVLKLPHTHTKKN